MELWLPEQIDLDETSNALIRDVEECARRFSELRPLPPDVVRRIKDDLLGERVYSSNAIEGNTLDLRETVMILKTGKISGGRKREHREARNLGDAVRKITEWVDANQSCHSTDRLLEVHAILLREINDDWAGRYRDRRVLIEGATRQPPDETLVPALMERLLERLTRPEDSNIVLLATWAHWGIARIHPFCDGNGRMARLWQDIVLLLNNLTCAVIRPRDRREYLDALGHADEGEFSPLVQLVAHRILMTFDKYETALRTDRELDSWITDLVGEADVRVAEQRKLAFTRWSRRMEQLRLEFEVCASRISDASADIKIQVRKFDLIDQQRWENIRSGLGATRTWFFVVDFRCRENHWQYYFFFGKHYWSDMDNKAEQSENRVCLLISEDDGSGRDAVRLDQMEDCPITLREIFVVDERFVRKRFDPATGDLYDRDISALQIALDFLREVVLRRLT